MFCLRTDALADNTMNSKLYTLRVRTGETVSNSFDIKSENIAFYDVIHG